jgi:hypothetical protein
MTDYVKFKIKTGNGTIKSGWGILIKKLPNSITIKETNIEGQWGTKRIKDGHAVEYVVGHPNDFIYLKKAVMNKKYCELEDSKESVI